MNPNMHTGTRGHTYTRLPPPPPPPPGLLMSGLVTLLDHPECVRSTLLHNKLVSLLLAMVGPQLDSSKRARPGSSMLAPTYLRPGEAALVAAVLSSRCSICSIHANMASPPHMQHTRKHGIITAYAAYTQTWHHHAACLRQGGGSLNTSSGFGGVAPGSGFWLGASPPCLRQGGGFLNSSSGFWGVAPGSELWLGFGGSSP